MMLSRAAAEAALEKFAAGLELVGERKRRDILEGLAAAEGRVSPDAVLAVKWLYANSPLSDWANYDFSLFLSCGSHGAFLRERSPYARDLPEELFLNYVLHIRVNEEELRPCRKEFYELLSERVRGLTDREAVIEANYWCAEQVTYRSTDERTISAMGAFRSGFGRCGEESAFAVNVFRALGIPARQIYTPRWAHCDDNHAWVEVWCGGDWHFLGACEPEEVLDRGWFTGAASRALVIHSRRFGDGAGEEVISQAGAVTFLNQLPRYAETRRLTVTVRDQAGRPAEGARVIFGILNYSAVFPAAEAVTGCDGTAGLTCGLGSVHLRAVKGNAWCERTVNVSETDRAELVLEEDQPVFGCWEDFVSYAPKAGIPRAAALTAEQRTAGRDKYAAARRKRERRDAAMFSPARAEDALARYGYSPAVYGLLEKSRGNLEELLGFLEDGRFAPEEKEALLLTLTEKDWRDVEADVLRETLAVRPEGGFRPETACPRIFREPLREHRRLILDYFSREQQAAFREDPARIWAWIQENIRDFPGWEYGQLYTCPAGALAAETAGPVSKKILFAAICRALGVAARLNPVDLTAEYEAGGGFRPVEPPEGGVGVLVLEKGPEEAWQYGASFSLGRLEEGVYQTLDLSGEAWRDDRLTFTLPAGVYRLITSNRLPNGDQYASRYHLRLAGGERKTVRLRKHQAELSAMLGSFRLEDFTVHDQAGRPVRGSELTRNKTVLLWLEEGQEPTEHILNELLEREAEFRSLPADLAFIVRGPEALENAKVKRVLEVLDGIRVYYGGFDGQVEALARQLYVDHEKLPLIAVTSGELNAVYASSGYNVGSGDMIVKICRLI